MESTLRIWGHHFFHPSRLALLVGNSVALLFFCAAIWSREGESSPVAGHFLLGFFSEPHPYLLFVATSSLWIHLSIISKHLRTRGCLYAVPLSRFHWLKWNTGFLLLLGAGSFALWHSRSPFWAAPILIAGGLTIISFVSRCLPLPGALLRRLIWLSFGLFVLLVWWVAPLYRFAAEHPGPAVFTGVMLTLGLPFIGARADYRRWKERHRFDADSPTALAPNPSASPGKFGQRGVFPPGDRTEGNGLLALFFPSVNWRFHPVARIILWRTVFATALLLFARLLQLHLIQTGEEGGLEALRRAFAEDMPGRLAHSIYLPILFFALPALLTSRGVMPVFQALGRRSYARCFHRLTIWLGILISLPLVLALALHDLALGAILGVSPSVWASYAFYPWLFLFLAALFPPALALGMRKRRTHREVPRGFGALVAVLTGSFLGALAFALWWDRVILPSLSAGDTWDRIRILGSVFAGQSALLVAVYFGTRRYLEGYFRSRPLA